VQRDAHAEARTGDSTPTRHVEAERRSLTSVTRWPGAGRSYESARVLPAPARAAHPPATRQGSQEWGASVWPTLRHGPRTGTLPWAVQPHTDILRCLQLLFRTKYDFSQIVLLKPKHEKQKVLQTKLTLHMLQRTEYNSTYHGLKSSGSRTKTSQNVMS
jgi:hypothetical protein